MTDRSVLVRLRADISDFNRKFAMASRTTSAFVKDLDTADSRMSNILQTATALAPTLVPLGAGATSAIAGLANQLGFAAAGAGATALAFNGVGDALTALNAYQLEPTEANLEKLRESMRNLGPAAREFVHFLDDISPRLQKLRLEAQEGLLPGAQEGMEELLKLTPQVRRIIGELAGTTGDLFAEAGDNLNDPRWREFFRFLEAEARPTLTTLGKTVGNLVEGLANTWKAFDPVNDQFGEGLLEWTRDFAEATRDLDDNEDFQSFLAYVQRVGPKAAATFGELVDATAALVAAAAPVGEATLPILKSLFQIIESVAESPAGPVLIGAAAGISAISRAVAVYNAVNGSAIANLLGVGKAGDSGLAQMNARVNAIKAMSAGIGVLTLSLTDLDDKMGISNTATLALIGSLAGPWGVAIGGAIGATKDLAASNNDAEAAIRSLDEAINAGNKKKIAEDLQAIQQQAAELANASSFRKGIAVLTGEMDDLADAAEQAWFALGDGKGAVGDVADLLFGPLSGGLNLTQDGFDGATQSAEDFRNELMRINGLLSKRADWRSYQAALDDFTKTVKENGRTLDTNTEKGRDNEAALDAIATTALRVAENLKGANRVRFLDQAREDFLDAAEKLNITDKRALWLVNHLGLLDAIKAKPEVELKGADREKRKADVLKDALDKIPGDYWSQILVDNGKAINGIVVVQRALASLHSKTIYIDTVTRSRTAVADGGTIMGQRMPYGDKVPALLAPGEEVISNRYGQADRNRGLLKAINANRFSAGGTAGSTPTTTPYGIISGDPVGELAKAAKDAAGGLKAHRRALEEDRDSLRELRDARQSLVQTAAGSFDRSPFGEGLTEAFGTLQATRNDARAMKAALRKAKKLGLSGDAFAALAASGDLQTAQELDTKAEVRKFERLYGQQQRAFDSLGQFAGTAFKGEIRELRQTIAQLERTVRHMRADVRDGAREGTRDGARQGMDANNRTGYGARSA